MVLNSSNAPHPNWLIVVGLEAEAKIARILSPNVAIGAPNFTTPPAAILSFGLAGGLDPTLRPGTIIIPTHVRSNSTNYPATPSLLGGATHDTLLASDTIIATASAKRALYHETNAAAVDMESGAVAKTATAAGIPFAVLRAICDPADRTLPPAALLALNSNGRINATRILASLLANPTQIAALLALARDAAKARRALLHRVSNLARRHMP